MDKNKLIIYQINPRMFTHMGNLREAKKLLPHIKSVGANVAYLFAICKEDDSKDRKFWSKRQKKSKLNNPKNPYRISDYFSIDEEFGGNEQLKEFIDEAHKLGLYVMMDLVYFHCSPNAKIINEVPDSVVRKENGEIDLGEWNFPKLNYKSRALRDYLIKNMLYYILEYGVDGYRCDVGDIVPLDFWQEAVFEIKKIKPDVIMLNEGSNPDYVQSGTFDFNYYWKPFVLATKPYSQFFKTHHSNFEQTTKEKGIYFVENHDSVTDDGRAETIFNSLLCDLFYVYLFTVNGTPLIYCGEEIADKNEHNMFANKDHNKGYGIDWSNSLLPHGKRRLSLIKKLSYLRKTEDCLAYGDFSWLDVDDEILSFERIYKNEKITVFINFSTIIKNINKCGSSILSRNYKNGKLSKYGFIIFKEIL
ncbi:MAG: hypothetical protein E7353_05130 [Clostridiales bacterium]|nr:hypothetical protein [Clostridiales bacterium]